MGFLGGIFKPLSMIANLATKFTPLGIGMQLLTQVMGPVLDIGSKALNFADQFQKFLPPGLDMAKNLLGGIKAGAEPLHMNPMPKELMNQLQLLQPRGGSTSGSGGVGTGQGSLGQQMLDKLGGQLNSSYKGMNDAINSVDKNDPQSQLKAQQAIQDFKQLMETMTNIMKMLHEMNMAVIHNMK